MIRWMGINLTYVLPLSFRNIISSVSFTPRFFNGLYNLVRGHLWHVQHFSSPLLIQREDMRTIHNTFLSYFLNKEISDERLFLDTLK